MVDQENCLTSFRKQQSYKFNHSQQTMGAGQHLPAASKRRLNNSSRSLGDFLPPTTRRPLIQPNRKINVTIHDLKRRHESSMRDRSNHRPGMKPLKKQAVVVSLCCSTSSSYLIKSARVNKTDNNHNDHHIDQIFRAARVKKFAAYFDPLRRFHQDEEEAVAEREEEVPRKHNHHDGNQVERSTINRARSLSTMLICASMLIVMLLNSRPAECVDCFKCSSRNGSNPACEDPFHNLNTTRITSPVQPDPPPNVIYHTPCYAGKKGRDGLFPASACIKLTGTFARMSHCGKFNFDGDSLKGCVLACPEDACNAAAPRMILAYDFGAPISYLASTILVPAAAILTMQLLSSSGTIHLNQQQWS